MMAGVCFSFCAQLSDITAWMHLQREAQRAAQEMQVSTVALCLWRGAVSFFCVSLKEEEDARVNSLGCIQCLCVCLYRTEMRKMKKMKMGLAQRVKQKKEKKRKHRKKKRKQRMCALPLPYSVLFHLLHSRLFTCTCTRRSCGVSAQSGAVWRRECVRDDVSSGVRGCV